MQLKYSCKSCYVKKEEAPESVICLKKRVIQIPDKNDNKVLERGR